MFEAAGAGIVDGAVIDVGTATDGDLAGLDLTGKIALVKRDPSFHRSAQLRNVTAKGAAAMLYLSVAPQNLRQVGSVRFDWEGAGTIPAITVGADDGAIIKTAVTRGQDGPREDRGRGRRHPGHRDQRRRADRGRATRDHRARRALRHLVHRLVG